MDFEQNGITYTKVIKEGYLPPFRAQFGITPCAFMAAIAKRPLTNMKVVAAAQIGLSGGFGFSEEGYNTPKSAPVPFERFTIEPKDMYVNIGISNKVIKLGTETGGIFPALKTEIEGAYKTAEWNTARALFGDGTGKLGTVAAATTTKQLKLDNVKNIKEGLVIDIYSGEAPKVEAVRIMFINRENNTLILDRAVTASEGDFVVVQNSYKRELTGLGCILNDDVDELYGIKKADNPIIVPTTVDANSTISDSVITAALRQSERDKNGKADMIIAGDTAYDSYLEYMRTDSIRVEESTHEITGGFKAIKFMHGNRLINIVNDSFVPDTEMWGVETGAFQFQHTDWDFAQMSKSGNAFQLLENKSVYRALLANYGDLICSNPGGCFKIKNVTA